MKDIFKDDVSLSRIKAVLTSLAKAGEINLCVLDVLGNPIIYPTNDCALCKCVRANAQGRAQCIKYASHSVLEAMREKRTYFYVCPFGLVDFVTPIFYDGEFLGAVCGGQVRSTEAAARADFVYPFFGRNEYGVDEKRMRELFEAMPDRPAERFFESAKLVELFAGNLGSVTAVVEMSRRGSMEPSTWVMFSSSKQRTTSTMAAHSRMLPRNWLPRPSPLLAPRTRPAMSMKSTEA